MSNFSDFEDLVLIAGDFQDPIESSGIPLNLRELLNTDKIKRVVCTGNIKSSSNYDFLTSLGNLSFVKGNDHFINLSKKNIDSSDMKTINISNRITALIIPSYLIPIKNNKGLNMTILKEYLLAMAVKYNVNCVIFGDGERQTPFIEKYEEILLISPGSVTGSLNAPVGSMSRGSFLLLAVRPSSLNAIVYVYEESEHGGDAIVDYQELKFSSIPS